jgi:hypothetical protein
MRGVYARMLTAARAVRRPVAWPKPGSNMGLVSIGCDHSSTPAECIAEWDVPMLSYDVSASMNAIREHAAALATQLRC